MGETLGIVGAGALGTLLSVRLARAGHTVRVLARSEIRHDSLRREAHGLIVDRDPGILAPASLVFVCVKAHDTETAAHSIAVTLPSPIGVCSLQNGWDHMSVLERALPGVPLVAGATALGAYFDSSGALHASTSGATLLAPWGATEIRWPEYAATVLQSADFVAETHEDARAVLWRKLALNAAVNPLTALLDRANGSLLDQPSLLRIAEAAAREAARVGIRRGYVPPDFDPATRLTALLEETRGNRSSMAEDLARGRRTEADAILGAILREGESVQERAPVIRALLTLMHAAERERGGPA